MNYLLRKAAGCGENLAHGEAMSAASGKAKAFPRLPKPFRENISPPGILDAIGGVKGPVCLQGSSLVLSHPFFPCSYSSFLEWKYLVRITVYWIYVIAFDLYRGSLPRVGLASQKTFWVWIFGQWWNCSDYGVSWKSTKFILRWDGHEFWGARGGMLWSGYEVSPQISCVNIGTCRGEMLGLWEL